MIDPLQTVLIVCSLLLAAVVLVYVVLDREPDWTLLGITGVVELLAVVQAGVGLVQVVRGTHQVDAAVFIGYLLSILVILPLAFFWSLAERSRGATAVLVVAALTVAFLVVRLGQVWTAGA
ncbi:MAG: hypothetical protein ACI379_16720 [Nocardioides sp.]|uniref:hypothetical protein n=1 Tax=Nocardioides sp. TaxID=35761 RepID=UPI003F105E85